MSCGPESVYVFGPLTLFGDDTTVTIHEVIAPMPTAGIRYIRATLELLALTTNASVQLAYQLSNDQLNWYDHTSRPALGYTLLGSALTTATTGYGVGFTSIPTNAQAGKMFIRIIALVKNTSTQAIVNVRVTGRVETRPA